MGSTAIITVFSADPERGLSSRVILQKSWKVFLLLGHFSFSFLFSLFFSNSFALCLSNQQLAQR